MSYSSHALQTNSRRCGGGGGARLGASATSRRCGSHDKRNKPFTTTRVHGIVMQQSVRCGHWSKRRSWFASSGCFSSSFNDVRFRKKLCLSSRFVRCLIALSYSCEGAGVLQTFFQLPTAFVSCIRIAQHLSRWFNCSVPQATMHLINHFCALLLFCYLFASFLVVP